MPNRRRRFVGEARRAKAHKTRVSEGQEGRSERPEGRRLTTPSAPTNAPATAFSKRLARGGQMPNRRRRFVSEARRAKAHKTRVSEGHEGRSERPEGGV